LAGTLQCYESSSGGEQLLPIWQVLTTPFENLRNRAERIAPQLAKAPGIASATAVETKSSLTSAGPFDSGWPSYAVALSPAEGDADALRERLASAMHPVLGRVERDDVVLDLRTVFPRQDKELVEALVGGSPAECSVEQGEAAGVAQNG